jgi:hypothetical protein
MRTNVAWYGYCGVWGLMTRFIEGLDRNKTTLWPERVDDYDYEHNPARAVDGFIDMLGLASLGSNAEPAGRPGYQPATVFKL